MEQSLFVRVERWLTANRPDYYARLQPGVADAQLDAKFSLILPPAFRDLYRWRNGQADGNYKSLQGNRMFSSLEEIAETKELLDGMIGYGFDRPEWWRLGWIPFLSNGGGSYLCVDVVAEDGGQPGQLVEFWKADEDRSVECPSMQAWMTALVPHRTSSFGYRKSSFLRASATRKVQTILACA